jgi:hypothetical protein
MKQLNLKSIIPHLIAVAIFAIVAIIYAKPALEGKVLQQTDITQWKGMAQDAFLFKEKYGNFPLWSNSMFGGMPGYQITGVPGFEYSIGMFDTIFTLGFPEPIGLFFLASICFYFLAQVLGFNVIISIIGALAYSYATYNPIIVMVGHITKMHTLAYLPFFIGSLMLLFQRKYLIGTTLTALATALFVQGNHVQINYYGLIIAVFMSVYYLIVCIKAKEFKRIYQTAFLAIIAGLIGVASNAPLLVSTYEYGKQSIRGGSALITKDSKTTATGLNKDYALSYSIFKSEALVMMFPNIYGGASDPNVIDPTKSKAIEVLQQMQPQVAQQLQSFVQFYWGGIGYTSGPPYVGIVICFLAILGFSAKNNGHKWWIIATILFTLMLASGSYLESFNVFMLKVLPLYNKFRAPSMILVVPTFLIGIMALYGLDAISVEKSIKDIWTNYKPSFVILGLVFGMVLFIYFNSDFKSENEKQLISQIAQMTDPNQKAAFELPVNDLVNAIATDRQTFIKGDLTKAVIYIFIVFALLFLSFKKVINQTILLVSIGCIAIFDLFQLDLKYLKHDSFIESAENENAFTPSAIDMAIKRDTSHYRVLDMRYGIQNAFNGGALIAYHHKTVGGYNAAKLSIYQDLIENQWYKFPNCLPTVNMMNTKYVITGNMATDTLPNPDALGNAWFVKTIKFEKGPAEVMKQLDNFDPKSTAIIEEKDKIKNLSNLQYDSLASILLVSNYNDEVNYQAKSSKKQFAVFSDIYYNLGWKAYVDGVETPIVKVNYVLRGLVVPAGQHAIKFEFKPTSIKSSVIAAGIASSIVWLLLAIIAILGFKKMRNNKKQ